MNFTPSITVAFTGHRSYDGSAADMLIDTIEMLYARGMRVFLCGMAVGFDISAAEAVIVGKALHHDIRLVAVVPFGEQALRFNDSDRERFRAILKEADETILLSAEYHAGVYALRNNYLVDHASIIIAWFDGSSGGTGYTVRRALSCGREVINLYPNEVIPKQYTLF